MLLLFKKMFFTDSVDTASVKRTVRIRTSEMRKIRARAGVGGNNENVGRKHRFSPGPRTIIVFFFFQSNRPKIKLSGPVVETRITCVRCIA